MSKILTIEDEQTKTTTFVDTENPVSVATFILNYPHNLMAQAIANNMDKWFGAFGSTGEGFISDGKYHTVEYSLGTVETSIFEDMPPIPKAGTNYAEMCTWYLKWFDSLDYWWSKGIGYTGTSQVKALGSRKKEYFDTLKANKISMSGEPGSIGLVYPKSPRRFLVNILENYICKSVYGPPPKEKGLQTWAKVFKSIVAVGWLVGAGYAVVLAAAAAPALGAVVSLLTKMSSKMIREQDLYQEVIGLAEKGISLGVTPGNMKLPKNLPDYLKKNVLQAKEVAEKRYSEFVEKYGSQAQEIFDREGVNVQDLEDTYYDIVNKKIKDSKYITKADGSTVAVNTVSDPNDKDNLVVVSSKTITDSDGNPVTIKMVKPPYDANKAGTGKVIQDMDGNDVNVIVVSNPNKTKKDPGEDNSDWILPAGALALLYFL